MCKQLEAPDHDTGQNGQRRAVVEAGKELRGVGHREIDFASAERDGTMTRTALFYMGFCRVSGRRGGGDALARSDRYCYRGFSEAAQTHPPELVKQQLGEPTLLLQNFL